MTDALPGCDPDAMYGELEIAEPRPCEACPLAATQTIHGSHLCDRCARESKRTERQR